MKKQILPFALAFLSTMSIFGDDSIYDFTLLDIEGREVTLSEYQDKVILIVNVASKCGFTGQYEGLEELYQQYKDQGLVILGFPANDFLRQEPGSNEEILTFCQTTYGVSFPMFSKIHVKGRNQEPLFKYLTDGGGSSEFSGRITWNFNKFLIDRQGNIVGRFDSAVEPLSEEILQALEAEL